jgi:hypothetical protein
MKINAVILQLKLYFLSYNPPSKKKIKSITPTGQQTMKAKTTSRVIPNVPMLYPPKSKFQIGIIRDFLPIRLPLKPQTIAGRHC